MEFREADAELRIGLSGDGLRRTARGWLCLRAQVCRLEISDGHIIGDVTNLTLIGRP